jgi:hypothetical protein
MQTLPPHTHTVRLAAATIAGLLALAVALLASASPAAASAKSDCATKGKTIVRSAVARVYSTTKRWSGEDLGEETVTSDEEQIYSCWLATGDRQRLDERCGPGDLDLEATRFRCDEHWELAYIYGRYAALYLQRTGDSTSSEDHIVQVRIGPKPVAAVVYKLPRFTEDVDPTVEKLFVSRSGAVAFSASDVPVSGAAKAVGVIGFLKPITDTTNGKPAYSELDSGAAVKPKSLNVTKKKGITWLNGATTKKASFG